MKEGLVSNASPSFGSLLTQRTFRTQSSIYPWWFLTVSVLFIQEKAGLKSSSHPLSFSPLLFCKSLLSLSHLVCPSRVHDSELFIVSCLRWPLSQGTQRSSTPIPPPFFKFMTGKQTKTKKQSQEKVVVVFLFL